MVTGQGRPERPLAHHLEARTVRERERLIGLLAKPGLGPREAVAPDPLPLHGAALPQQVQQPGRRQRAGPAVLLLSPLVRFVKMYFFRLGFLDGLPGLIHISVGCMNSFLKYAKLIELKRAKKDG